MQTNFYINLVLDAGYASNTNLHSLVLRMKADETHCFSDLFDKVLYRFRGPGSVVGIATDYGLDGPGIEFWWG